MKRKCGIANRERHQLRYLIHLGIPYVFTVVATHAGASLLLYSIAIAGRFDTSIVPIIDIDRDTTDFGCVRIHQQLAAIGRLASVH